MEINTADAKERGIENGDTVVVKTPRNSIPMCALVSDNIKPGTVYAAVGGGGPLGTEAWQKANANMLTDFEQYDPISGFPVYKTLLCQISKKRRKRRGMAVQDPSLGCVGVAHANPYGHAVMPPSMNETLSYPAAFRIRLGFISPHADLA